MWCGFRRSSLTIATASVIAVGGVISNNLFVAGQQNYRYNPQQFLSVLRGLGYNVDESTTSLNSTQATNAIREFQRGYRLGVDGIAGPKTQNFAGRIVKNLKYNLNLVLEPDTPLPLDQYYGPQTIAAVRAYQQQLQLEQTGIANLQLRQRLNQQAQAALEEPTPTATPTVTPTPTPTPTITPTPTPTPTITPTPIPTPTITPIPTPTLTPTPIPTPTPTVTPTPLIPGTTPTPGATPAPIFPDVRPVPTSTPQITPTPIAPETTPTPEETP